MKPITADQLQIVLHRLRDHVSQHVIQWDDAKNGSHHHPIWKEVARALERPAADATQSQP